MKHFKQFGNYRINKWFMRSIILILLIAISGVYLYHINKDPLIYIECESTLGCYNPFIDRLNNCEFSLAQQEIYPIYKEVCSKDRMMYGEHLGKKYPPYLNYFLRLAISLILISIFLNHIIYNRRLKWNKQELKLIQKGLEQHLKKSTKNTIDLLKKE